MRAAWRLRSRRESPVAMTHAPLAPLIGAEFDKFLGAPIGEGRNGTPLSVLSALARLDVDPWQEAASLARMPVDAAATRLTALIAALPGAPTKDVPAMTIAADLVTLLPRVASFTVGPSDGVFAAGGAQQAQIRFALGALALMAMIALALSASLSSAPGNGAKPSAAPMGVTTSASSSARSP
ncbi:MAG: hypothetical protein ABSF67_22205 [Roseiarcus sp.]|jgi:hypothetical protein